MGTRFHNAQDANYQVSRARALLPDGVAFLGIPGEMVLVHPETAQMYVFVPKPTTMLCSDGDGREMFILNPFQDAGAPIGNMDVALHVTDLYERFTHRRSDGYYNVFCPAFRKPKYCGHIAIIRYTQQKDLDDDSKGEMIEWEHYFEPENYADLFSVGKDQYVIPHGGWRITERGIVNE